MKAIVGLGNPGENYTDTRHNAGFVVLDKLAAKFGCSRLRRQERLKARVCKQGDYIFVKPTTFMNLSGQAVRAIMDYYKLDCSSLYVIHDDLDLELGSTKIQLGTGPQGHNGLLSIYQHLGGRNFWHVRVGVDNRQGSRVMEPSDYVLQKFSQEERKLFNQAADGLADELYNVLR